ncbi:MAG: phytanoyl-CoA dioxygenase family protein [Rhodospirillales bacterium]|nr:phytanoyl-CoA dioxygenase family protein [Rhodospirillales bacterium]
MLTDLELAQYRTDGYVMVRGAANPDQVRALRAEADRWVDESRAHPGSYGETPNGKTRFDLEAGHSAAAPRLRRIANPVDISDVYKDFVWDGPVPDLVAQLVGPDVKFHHCKLNIKMPGMAAYVGYHQDHAFTPHTNDDMVTALLLLDDMSEDNGCLMVVPRSHRRQLTHYEKDVFRGVVAGEHRAEVERNAVPMIGKSGDLCLMHSWCVHGSGENRSERPRRMFIADYTAADAFPLTPSNIPSIYSGHIIRGKPTRVARLVAATIELPAPSAGKSVFEVQGQGTAYEG